MSQRRYERTDFEWSIIEPLLPKKPRGKPRVDDRRVLNGINLRLRTGSLSADIPERYGLPPTCANLFRRWAKIGVGHILLADCAYDSDALRRTMADRDAWDNIKPVSRRIKKAIFSSFLDRERNLVERFFNKLKHYRAIATRYEKTRREIPCPRQARRNTHLVADI